MDAEEPITLVSCGDFEGEKALIRVKSFFLHFVETIAFYLVLLLKNAIFLIFPEWSARKRRRNEVEP